MVIKPCEKGKDQHVSNILYTVMWKCEPMKKQQSIEHITNHVKPLQTDQKWQGNMYTDITVLPKKDYGADNWL